MSYTQIHLFPFHSYIEVHLKNESKIKNFLELPTCYVKQSYHGMALPFCCFMSVKTTWLVSRHKANPLKFCSSFLGHWPGMPCTSLLLQHAQRCCSKTFWRWRKLRSRSRRRNRKTVQARNYSISLDRGL